jgi:hypothetical protein
MAQDVETGLVNGTDGLSGNTLQEFFLESLKMMSEFFHNEEDTIFRVGGCIGIGLGSLGITLAVWPSGETPFLAKIFIVGLLQTGTVLAPAFEYFIGGAIGLGLASLVERGLDKVILAIERRANIQVFLAE